jgi:Fur family ferric uptake transcriptional regulator
MDAQDDKLRGALNRAGKRLTAQRRLILEVLKEGEGHLDAEMVHDRVKARDPRISLATVYRTLAVFQEMGLVEQHRLGEDHSHYEEARGGPHYHFTCLGCGDVIEFEAPEVTRVARRLGKEKSVQITEAHLSLAGYCARCQSKAEEA